MKKPFLKYFFDTAKETILFFFKHSSIYLFGSESEHGRERSGGRGCGRGTREVPREKQPPC